MQPIAYLHRDGSEVVEVLSRDGMAVLSGLLPSLLADVVSSARTG